MTLWSLWYNRNRIAWDKVDDSAPVILSCGHQVFTDWLIAQKEEGEIIQVPLKILNNRWRKPPRSFVKCNVDVFFLENNQY